jgi:outer membrane immunogenic protein
MQIRSSAMPRILALAIGTMALGIATAASAADMGPVHKGPPPMAPVVAPYFNWSGFYIGAFAGGAWSGHATTTERGRVGGGGYNGPVGHSWNYDLDGSFIGGGTIGFNWQAPGSSLVLGIEGEVGYLKLEGSALDPGTRRLPAPPDTRAHAKIGDDWYAVLAGRVGFAWDRALIYAKGGAAFLDVNTSVIDNCFIGPRCGPATVNAHGSHSDVTWAIGGGIEWAFAHNWTVKAEYLYLDTNETVRTCGPGGAAGAGSTFCWDTHVKGTHTAKIGVNYLFNWGGAPVAARY